MNGDYEIKMVYLYAIDKLINNLKNVISFFLPVISIERRQRAERFWRQCDSVDCILGEVLMRYILWKHFGVGRNDVSFRYDQNGKPFLVGACNLHFNISHSSNWILCGVREVHSAVLNGRWCGHNGWSILKGILRQW